MQKFCAKLALTIFMFFLKGKLEGTFPCWPETHSGMVSLLLCPEMYAAN